MRTHEKSSDDEQEREENAGERKESDEEGKLGSVVIPFIFHRGIKSKLAGFPMIRKNHSRVFITYYEVEELYTMSFMSFLCVFFSFHKVFVSPGQVQVFTPVKGFTQQVSSGSSFAPNTSKDLFFIMEHYFLLEKISDYSAREFC